ncbi:SRPBCC family protein [Catenibacillus scindens]|uniref:SRPBCC family protein n=1 Tax=Catenibacillus scindens TaxID=673271 RepID=UPI00320AE0CF
MATINTKASFQCPVQKVWQTVVALTNYSWRRNIEQVEIIKSGKKFIEHTKKGRQTTFRVTASETCRRYDLNMENKLMKGHYTYRFSNDKGETSLDITLDADAKWYFKPFAGFYLKKQVNAYIEDLRKAVEK